MSNTDPSAMRGPTVTFKAGTTDVVFRRPTREEWDNHCKRIANPKNVKSALIRELCQKCLLTPSFEEFQAIFNKKPAYPTRMAGALADLAGKSQPYEVIGDEQVATTVNGQRFTFSVPSLETWEDFQEQLTRGGSSVERERELCLRCSDQPEALAALFDSYPALQDPLSDGICEIAGAFVEGEVKKG